MLEVALIELVVDKPFVGVDRLEVKSTPVVVDDDLLGSNCVTELDVVEVEEDESEKSLCIAGIALGSINVVVEVVSIT